MILFTKNKPLPIDKESQKSRCFLAIFIFIDLGFTLLRLFFSRLNSLVSLCSCLLLAFAFISSNYIIVSILIFFLLYDSVNIFLFLLLRIQNSILKLDDKYLVESFYVAIVVIEVLILSYNIVKIVVSFKAFNNFKHCFAEILYGNYQNLNNDIDVERNYLRNENMNQRDDDKIIEQEIETEPNQYYDNNNNNNYNNDDDDDNNNNNSDNNKNDSIDNSDNNMNSNSNL